MSKIRLTTLSIALIYGGLLVVAVLLWRHGQLNIQQTEQVPAHKLAMPDLSAVSTKPVSSVDIASIREDAVFHSHRSYYRPARPPQIIAVPEYDLSGTMGLPQGKRVAFVKRRADQTTRTLHLGDDLDGWRVEGIDLTQVVISQGDQRYELKANTAAAVTGLVRAETTPRVVQSSGLRILGGQSTGTSAPDPSNAVRRYRPPPPL